MRRKLQTNIAVSIIEYALLLMLIMAGLILMKGYISHAFNGHWKQAGDAFGNGRQYQAGQTMDCAYAQINADYGAWYDNTCYAQAVTACAPGDNACEDAVKIGTCAQAACCEQNKEPSGHSNCG